mgnify:CR=1 FL=1
MKLGDLDLGTLQLPEVGPGTVVALLALLGLSAFFASGEAALFSLQRVDREALKEDPSVGETVRHLLAVPRRLLAAILMGNELVNIALAAAVAQLVDAPLLSVLIVAPLLVLLGDIVPKTLGIRFARTVARATARPLSFWNELVSPFRFALTAVADFCLRLLGFAPQPPSEALEEAQLRALIDQGLATGVIQPMEQEIIHRVFEFGDLPVSRVMTPRPDIFALAATTPWPELVAKIREARYSRVPIYQGQPENVIGILLVKDLLRARAGGGVLNARQLQKLLHPAMFVPPSKRAQDLLREFRAKNMHMAVVVDEHGSCVGLATLDDLLTELVGEVLDETDEHEKEVSELGPGVWAVKAGMDVDDFGERLACELPEGEYTTVGGFVFHLLGRAPEKGDEVEWNGMRFLVAGMDGRRITELTVSGPPADPAPAGAP